MVANRPPLPPLTVDVAGVARLLFTTEEAVIKMRQRGQLPRPIRKKPAVWRIDDILAMMG